jgi:uncharacterized protein YndB with AHSA1/START domain
MERATRKERTMTEHLATARTEVKATRDRVWQALTDPEQIKEYMFGAEVDSDFQPGSPITWRGEWEGKAFEDKGDVLAADRGRMLEMTHFSSMSGREDKPENYHRVRYELSEKDGTTTIELTQHGSGSAEEAEHSSKNWQGMLDGLKKVVEKQPVTAA